MTVLPATLTAPVHALTPDAMDQLELILGGLYAPADGYCLPSQPKAHWPWPFALRVPGPVAEAAVHEGLLVLSHPDGTPLAALSVTDTEQAGPAFSYVAGTLARLRAAEHPPARRFRLTTPLPARGHGSSVVAAFSKEPTGMELAQAIHRATELHAQLWLVAVADSQPPKFPVLKLLDFLAKCAKELTGTQCALLISPSPLGEKATVHARLTAHALAQLGADSVLDFSDSMEPPPVSLATAVSARKGAVILLTGLSGAGKSTIAGALAERLSQSDPRPVTLLDGDDVRRLLSAGLGFSREDRETNVRRIGWVASLISRSGGVAVCAPIAPFESGRQEVRRMAEAEGDFILVHVSTSLDVCEQRDRKGLYARARAGDLQNFTGVDSPYELPRNANVVLDTSQYPVDVSVERILVALSAPD